jgi:Holliday junction resolvase RusA-like endonuclease
MLQQKKIMLDEMTIKEYQDVYRLRMFIFEIHSEPKVQKQTQQGVSFSGRKQFYDPSAMNKKQIQWQVQPHAPKEPLLGAIEMHLTFYLPIPKHIKGIERQSMINNIAKHYKRPDIDNLAYLVTNALKGIVYKDDSQICVMRLEKRYAEEPKTVIMVKEV